MEMINSSATGRTQIVLMGALSHLIRRRQLGPVAAPLWVMPRTITLTWVGNLMVLILNHLWKFARMALWCRVASMLLLVWTTICSNAARCTRIWISQPHFHFLAFQTASTIPASWTPYYRAWLQLQTSYKRYVVLSKSHNSTNEVNTKAKFLHIWSNSCTRTKEQDQAKRTRVLPRLSISHFAVFIKLSLMSLANFKQWSSKMSTSSFHACYWV